MPLEIKIKTIPNHCQDYNTVGNWWKDENASYNTFDALILVSQFNDWRYEVLVAVHELVETILCKQNNVSTLDVTQFDKDFLTNSEYGGQDEPGDDPASPYYGPHQIATIVERTLAAALDVNWNNYADACEALFETYEKNKAESTQHGENK